jgi:hypothetical protein
MTKTTLRILSITKICLLTSLTGLSVLTFSTAQADTPIPQSPTRHQSLAAIPSAWLTTAGFSTTLGDGASTLSVFNIERLDRCDVGTNFGNITRVFDGVSYTIRNNSQSSSINGSLTVEAGWTNQEPLSVTVSLSFTDTILEPADSSVTEFPGFIDPIEPFQWQTGTTVISANDGSSITVTPTTPSAQSFSIELSNGESIGPLLWSDGHVIDCGSATVCGES